MSKEVRHANKSHIPHCSPTPVWSVAGYRAI